MKQIILILCFVLSWGDDIIGGVNISYDMNETSVDEVRLFISKSIKNGSLVSQYNMQIKHFENNFILDIANISFSHSLGKVIIGKSTNRNAMVYLLANRFELFKDDEVVDGITYITPDIGNSISEFDYIKRNNTKVFRTIWMRNDLETSFYYRWNNTDESFAIGLHNNTSIVDFGYTYENYINIKTIHSFSFFYKLGNYHYKSLYSFDNLDKEIFITGFDIILMKDSKSEAKIYLENSYGNIKEVLQIGVNFNF